jgi:acyl-CoA synthetase (AMP-forming)/AMP-acid ligase II
MNQSLGAVERNLIERVNVGDILTRGADLCPTRLAIVDGDREVTYEALESMANRLASALLGLGLVRQQVVAVMSRNRAELLVAYFACARAGLVCAPINLALTAREIAWCLRDARARVLLAEQALAPALDEVLREPMPDLQYRFRIDGDGPESFAEFLGRGSEAPVEVAVADRDTAQLLYTSGTTAHPKGVLTSHLAVTMTGMTNAIVHQCRPGLVAYVQLPLFHCAMLNFVCVPVFLTGGTLILANGFDAHHAASLFDEHQIELIVLLPMMYGQLLSDPVLSSRTFPSVRRAMYAMAPQAEERLHQIHAMFPNADVVLGSGQTEFTPATCVQRPEHQWSKASTWGTPTPLTRVAIMGPDGQLLPRGCSGELVYRGPQVMNGYLNQPEATADAMRHGWFHSGDVAHLDEDGAICFEDRLKDVIKTGGENVASIEVERCLLAHPEVLEAAVVGAPHERWGEAITAVVIGKPGSAADEAELLEHCRSRLARFKVPKRILFTDALPRTGTGKIQKHVLRTELAGLYPHGNRESSDV